MTTTGNPIEIVQHLILDILQPFIMRIDALEEHVNVVAHGVDVLSVRAPDVPTAPQQAQVDTPVTNKALEVLEGRVEAVVAMHRLDASPAQWEQDQSGKRVMAPEGLWELTCSGCDYSVMWMQGDKDPRRCKTVETLTR